MCIGVLFQFESRDLFAPGCIVRIVRIYDLTAAFPEPFHLCGIQGIAFIQGREGRDLPGVFFIEQSLAGGESRIVFAIGAEHIREGAGMGRMPQIGDLAEVR